MSKPITLNRNGDFKRIYSKGSAHVNPALVTYIMKNRAGICRIGITSSKKIGNAVARNKARRLVRAAFRQLYSEEAERLSGFDFVFVCRGRTRHKKSTEIMKIMQRQLREAAVLSEEKS